MGLGKCTRALASWVSRQWDGEFDADAWRTGRGIWDIGMGGWGGSLLCLFALMVGDQQGS